MAYNKHVPVLRNKALRPSLPNVAIHQDRPLAITDFARPRTSVAVVSGRSILTRPKGTRLYVPGFLSDATQEAIDRKAAATQAWSHGGGSTQDDFALDVQQDQFTGIGMAFLAPVASYGVSKLVNQHPEDVARYSQNTAWYNAASAGDRIALNHLGVKGGVLPPGTGGDPGPWATSGPRSDAAQKYQNAASGFRGTALLAPLAPSPSGGQVPVPTPPPSMIPAVTGASVGGGGGADLTSLIQSILGGGQPSAAPAPDAGPAPTDFKAGAGSGSMGKVLLMAAGLFLVPQLMNGKKRRR